MKLLDNMFNRVNGSGWKFVTLFFNTRFECKDEQSTSNILTVNFIISAKFKKASSVLENGCSTLTVKLQI